MWYHFTPIRWEKTVKSDYTKSWCTCQRKELWFTYDEHVHWYDHFRKLCYIVKLEKYIWKIPCHSAYVLLDMSFTEIGTCSLGDIYMIVCNTIVINNKNNPNVNWQENIPVQISELQIYRTWIMNRGIGLFSKCTILKTI